MAYVIQELWRGQHEGISLRSRRAIDKLEWSEIEDTALLYVFATMEGRGSMHITDVVDVLCDQHGIYGSAARNEVWYMVNSAVVKFLDEQNQ